MLRKEISSTKHQITNKFQAPNSKFQTVLLNCLQAITRSEATGYYFEKLEFRYCLLFGICDLGFSLRSSGIMPRIAGVNIPENKQIEIALTYIYGIGRSLGQKILREAEINPQRKAGDLNPEEIARLKEIIEKNFKIEGELRRRIITDIKRLKDIRSWRGLRHIAGLPVRGQTTRVNSRTVRGNVRKTVGSGRKPPPAPK